jgi:hypothetical protein
MNGHKIVVTKHEGTRYLGRYQLSSEDNGRKTRQIIHSMQATYNYEVNDNNTRKESNTSTRAEKQRRQSGNIQYYNLKNQQRI